MSLQSILSAFTCTIDFFLAFLFTVYVLSERKKIAKQHIVFFIALIVLFAVNIGLILYH